MSLIEKLKAGKNNIKATAWPGTDERIGIVILTEAEIQAAHFETELLFKQRGIEFTAATVDTYQSEQNTQALARAIVDVTTKKPIFKNADELRGLLNHPDIKAALTSEYNEWQADCSPAIETMSEEKYDALFADVKKNPSILSDLNSKTLKGLIIYLADRQTKLQMVSGSTS
jgi:hypothetical protein